MRVGAQGAGAGGGPVFGEFGVGGGCVAWASGGCNDAVGGLAAFDPVDEGGEGVELVGGGAGAAVVHAGDGEVAGEVACFTTLIVTLGIVDAVDPRGGVVMGEDGIAHAVVEQNFCATCFECLKVSGVEFAGGRDLRVGGFGELGVGRVDGGEAFVDIDCEWVADAARGRHEDVAGCGVEGLGVHEFPLRPVRARDASVIRKGAVEWHARCGGAACMDCGDLGFLRGGEAIAIPHAGAGGHIAHEVESFLAGGGILHDAVFCAIECVAFLKNSVGYRLALLCCEGCAEVGKLRVGCEGVIDGGIWRGQRFPCGQCPELLQRGVGQAIAGRAN